MQAIGFDRLLSNSSLTYGLAPALHLPLFDGGHLQSQLGMAHCAYNIAVEQYNQSLLQALEEISNRLVALDSLQRQQNEAHQAKQLSDHAYAVILKAYRAGLANYLSVLNAQEQTLVQTNHCAQIDAQYLEAYALLMQALGGGAAQGGLVPVNQHEGPSRS
nr:TolC family protein [uncultured Desulfobulbus sp.]